MPDVGWLRSAPIHAYQKSFAAPPTLVSALRAYHGILTTPRPLISAEKAPTYIVPITPRPAIVDNCIPDVLTSLHTAIATAVLCMILVSCLVWMLASIPPRRDSDQTLRNSQLNTTHDVVRPLLPGQIRKLNALEGLRTVLIVYILVYHVRWALPVSLVPYFYWGHWAVQFFFVLSGFVAAYVHQCAAPGPIDFNADTTRKLVVRRLTRLCPAYFAALLMVAAVIAHRGGGEPFLAWPVQALLLQSLMPVTVCGPLDTGHWSHNFLPFSANGEGWFVSAILIASLCFPVLHNIRPRKGFWATLRALLFVIILRSAPTFLTMAGWCPFSTYVFAPVRVLEFAAGMLSAQLFQEMPVWMAECGAWDWIFDASLLCAGIPIWFLGYWHSWVTCESMHGDFFLTCIFCVTCMSARGLAEQSAECGSRALQAHFLVRPCEEKERGCECQCGVCSFGSAPLSGLLTSKVLVLPAVYSYQAFIFQEIFCAGLSILPLYWRLWWIPVTAPWVVAVLSVHCLEEPLRCLVEARLRASQQPASGK